MGLGQVRVRPESQGGNLGVTCPEAPGEVRWSPDAGSEDRPACRQEGAASCPGSGWLPLAPGCWFCNQGNLVSHKMKVTWR